MTLQFRIADHGDFDGIWAVLMDGKAALGHLGIDQWQGAYPTQQIVRDDIEAGHSYVLEEDGEVVATTVIGFTGEPVYDSIEGAWLTASDSRDPRYAVLHMLRSRKVMAGRALAAICCNPLSRLPANTGARVCALKRILVTFPCSNS